MELIKIVLAVLILGLIARYITYILGFFSIIPTSLMVLVLFGLALNVILFVIHRGD